MANPPCDASAKPHPLILSRQAQLWRSWIVLTGGAVPAHRPRIRRLQNGVPTLRGQVPQVAKRRDAPVQLALIDEEQRRVQLRHAVPRPPARRDLDPVAVHLERADVVLVHGAVRDGAAVKGGRLVGGPAPAVEGVQGARAVGAGQARLVHRRADAVGARRDRHRQVGRDWHQLVLGGGDDERRQLARHDRVHVLHAGALEVAGPGRRRPARRHAGKVGAVKVLDPCIGTWALHDWKHVAHDAALVGRVAGHGELMKVVGGAGDGLARSPRLSQALAAGGQVSCPVMSALDVDPRHDDLVLLENLLESHISGPNSLHGVAVFTLCFHAVAVAAVVTL